MRLYLIAYLVGCLFMCMFFLSLSLSLSLCLSLFVDFSPRLVASNTLFLRGDGAAALSDASMMRSLLVQSSLSKEPPHWHIEVGPPRRRACGDGGGAEVDGGYKADARYVKPQC